MQVSLGTLGVCFNSSSNSVSDHVMPVSKTEMQFGQCYVGRLIWCSVGMHGHGVVSVVTGWEHHDLSLNPKRDRLFFFLPPPYPDQFCGPPILLSYGYKG